MEKKESFELDAGTGQKGAFCKGLVPDIELSAWAASVGGYIFSHKLLVNDPGC